MVVTDLGDIAQTECVGAIPSTLCSLTSLNYLKFASVDITCYPSCLSSVANLETGDVPLCPTEQEVALCSIVSATNIFEHFAVFGGSMWSCDAVGVPIGDPYIWSGLSHDDGAVVAVDFESLSLAGGFSVVYCSIVDVFTRHVCRYHTICPGSVDLCD